MKGAERERFDELFEEALEGLPPGIAALLDEIPVIVDDRPEPKLLEELAREWGEEEPVSPDGLAGLHTGIALTERSVEHGEVLPTEIRLFREGIIALAGGWDQPEADDIVYEEIVITLLHEIGHHFGLDEEDLARLGYD